MYQLYMVQCSDSTIYTGIAVNAENRAEVHNSGKGAKYTKTRLPVKLIYIESGFLDRSSASKREYEIKKMTRAQKLALALSYSSTLT